MSDQATGGKPGRIESRITTGNLLTILGTVVAELKTLLGIQ